ncbi:MULTISPECIES: ABC transporter ATP-binding protein [unclassified Beijerinckia]|uniref:ABC transporter ATP-binding protein n=1 Tax=unclassified Beijerinckia TaxID=2638183 RepID=UPI00089AC699|nr:MULTISPECIES: ABC transporter ATP-binding protein [unclassified Beijerinckia]MDH7796164.1 branched-chain amino acid transport system ATP-binding protein [Beijerinckia sp. GAS462]SEC33150.1 amino acid/amide ABC transporter ATP-binding protein 2, HAAT family [Beijerinckia sp. 28-YEA-48]
MSEEPLLSVNGLEAGYGESRVLFGIGLDIREGEVVTLLGRNGMGKTTTIHTIMGIVTPTAGNIRFRGAAVDQLPAYAIARRGIGLVPEGRQIFPNLSVRENLVATATRRNANGWDVERVLRLFPPLRERLSSWGNLLSGGEQQMLAIGRALLTNPRLLILDEATEGLAPLVRAHIWGVIEEIKATGMSILIVDKNVEALTRIADRHYVLERGRVVWSGTSAALLADTEIKTRYLGV